VRPEDADRISPTLFHASGKPGLRVKLSAPVPLPRRSPEAPAIPPKPTTPPLIPTRVSEAHSASPVRTVEETDELYRGPGWEALFLAQTVFGADTMDMPKVETPEQTAHVCKHCKELHNGVMFGARIWRCDACKVIATY